MDHIEKRVVLKAKRDRVWRAISRAEEFGSWFGLRVDGEFRAGVTLKASMVPTTVDDATAAKQKAYEGKTFDLEIAEVTPTTRFAFRWHPYAVDGTDVSQEPKTLVLFELADVEGGTQLTVTESGFDKIPLERRAKAFAANEGGWQKQTELVVKYLAQHGE